VFLTAQPARTLRRDARSRSVSCRKFSESASKSPNRLNRTANTGSSVSAKVKVPFLELKPAYDELRVGFDAAYRRVMDSGWYVLAVSYAGATPVPVEPAPQT